MSLSPSEGLWCPRGPELAGTTGHEGAEPRGPRGIRDMSDEERSSVRGEGRVVGSRCRRRFFVATRASDVPDGVTRFASVDGSVPGAAVTWDHHVSGELVNLDALPSTIETEGLEAIGTTLADTDAVASAVVVASGGEVNLPGETVALLRSASHWCDHLEAHPALPAELNRRGLRVHRWVARELRAHGDASLGFEAAVRALLDAISTDAPLPELEEPTSAAQSARVGRAAERLKVVFGVALIDLRDVGSLDPMTLHALHESPVAVLVYRHEQGGPKYTVGVNPFVAHPSDIGPALRQLAALEFAHGLPALSVQPGPGSENWGGRATVFGSPWNYASRLEPDEVAGAVGQALGLEAP